MMAHHWIEIERELPHLTAAEKLQLIAKLARSIVLGPSGVVPPEADRFPNAAPPQSDPSEAARQHVALLEFIADVGSNSAGGTRVPESDRDHDRVIYGIDA